ncbi:hypothetical protein APSETT444_007891 [Aspergillus pseudonomiae]
MRRADENRHRAVNHVANASLGATGGNPSAGLALNGRMRLTDVCIDATLSGYWTLRSMFPSKGWRGLCSQTDRYLEVLHRHIRELEEVCHEAGIPVPTFNPDAPSMDSDEETPQIGLGIQFDTPPAFPNQGNTRAFPPPIKPETFPSLLTNPQEGDFNLLIASNLCGGNEGFSKQPNTFMGSPPSACLIRLLTQGHLLRDIPHGPAHAHLDGSLLPPRDFADHLLGCFWDRVYCLYPFFDRSSVQDAYEGLWTSGNTEGQKSSELNIGLGGKSDSGRQSPVFICALNIMFALGCHFAEISVPDRNGIAHTFFLRAKQNIGLDLLEVRTIGAVQTLLMASLYLQSIPDCHKSWDLVGMACRISQGLGLHENRPDSFKDPLELEIQRRTWHGCVMMDTLELGSILDTVLSAVHKARCDRPRTPASSTTTQQDGVDVVVKLEEKLAQYKGDLPAVLRWDHPFNPATDVTQLSTLRRQRNVLHARFLYVQIRLYRAAFTHLCSEMLAQEDSETDHHDPVLRTLYSSTLSKRAAACAKAAIELASLVHDNYQTTTTNTWWYNCFYTSVAGMVLVMSYTCVPALSNIEKTAVHEAWRKCEQILQFMIPYHFSSRNTLLFFRAARDRILSYLEDTNETSGPDKGPESSHVDGVENPFADDAEGLFNGANWLGSAVAMVGLGFLCPADFKWFQNWLAEEMPFAQHKSLEEYDAHLSLPTDYRNTFTADLNSSFHTEYGFTGSAITHHISWSLFKIKMVEEPGKYAWIQASVFINWDLQANQQRIFFVNVPDAERKQLEQTFPARNMRDRNPYIWHAVFAHAMSSLYHKSFWKQRNVIREIEKIRNADSENLPKFLKGLNDSARHAVHLNETMEVAEHTMNRLLTEHSRWRDEFPEYVMGENNAVRGTFFQTRQKLAFVAKEIHSARVRSRTLSDRLASEIQLGIFGSNFFDYQSGEKESWEMSHKFWLYWVVTIPLTLATFAVWALWHYRAKFGGFPRRRRIGDASEKV